MTTTSPAPLNGTPDQLRTEMVDVIAAVHGIPSPRIEEALRAIERHAHLPGVNVYEAYMDKAVTIKPNPAGPLPLSCASVPSTVSMMLHQLDAQPGESILEIGAGTGYNAALLAHLVGESGQVTTVDIDPEVTAHARAALDATGYSRVHVITRDGALGATENAPYDRMIATVGMWDVPPAWWEQLAAGGRLVLPLRWRGQTRSIGLTYTDGRLVSDAIELCGFLPIIGQNGELTAPADEDGHVRLHWDADQPITPKALHGLWSTAPVTQWSAATVGPEDPFDGVWLHASAAEPGCCRIEIDPEGLEAGARKPANMTRTPALVDGDSVAYMICERIPGDAPLFALGAVGYGTAGEQLANRLCRQIDAWNINQAAQPAITIYPADAAIDVPEGAHVIDKPHSRIVIAF